MTEQQTLYKLIVLYMLEKIDFSLTFTQISNFVLEKGYTTYFTLQTSIAELVENNLIHAETVRNMTYYTITPEGEETLGYFEKRLSEPLREDILQYLKDNGVQMRDESSILADYYRNMDGEYDVRCRVLEKNSSLIDLTVTVPFENQAKAICRQWKSKCQGIYEYIMKELMQ